MKSNQQIYGLVIFLIWGVLSSLQAQNVTSDLKGHYRRAEKLFTFYAYTGAVESYLKVLEKEPDNKEVKLKIAGCYRMLNDPKNSAIWYAKIIKEDLLINPEHKLYFAESLSQIGRYEQAKKWYEEYKKDVEKLELQDIRPERKIEGIQKLERFYRDSAQYKVWEINANSEQSDFGVAYFRNGVVFSSSRPKPELIKRTFKWTEERFLDMYFAERIEDSDTSFSDPKIFKLDINTKFHDGTLCVFDKEQKIIFTRNQFFKGKTQKSEEQVHKLSLYLADLDSGKKASNFQDLPFNNPEISNGHPTITPDGKTLIFVSDRPESIGETDLYMIPVDSLFTATPVNLGSHINTKGKEMFPFIASDNTLYFASDGREGLGGLDIYRVKLSKITKDSVYAKRIKNLGFPINTSTDDFGLILSEDRKRGHFCSNREGGTGDDDIYSAELPTPQPAIMLVNIKLFKKYPNEVIVENLENADLQLIDYEDSVILDKSVSDKKGNHLFDITTDKVYQVTGEKIPFGTDFKIEDVPIGVQDTVRVNLRLELEVPTCISYQGRVVEKKTKQPLANATVFIFNEETKELEETMTDAEGRFTACLDTMTSYVVRGVKRYYLPDCYKIQTGELVFQTVEPERDLELDKIELNQTFTVENLYFDFDKYNIRPDAAKVLDELVDFLTQHNYLKVELGSHTDCRGSFRYNEVLSDNRAKSSVAYIIKNGISSERITAKGYGEYQLTNQCADGVRCTPAEHQANRRTEVKVIGFLEQPDAEISDADSGHGQPFDKNGNHSDCLPIGIRLVKTVKTEKVIYEKK